MLMQSSSPRYFVSTRADMYNKRLKHITNANGEKVLNPPPQSKEEAKEQSRIAGLKSGWNWHTYDWTMTQLAEHIGTGNAMSVSIYRGGHRINANLWKTYILGLDFENGGITAEMLRDDELLRQWAGLILPSASDTPEEPRARVFIPLSRSVSDAEYTSIWSVFADVLYPNQIDQSTSDATRLFFGSDRTVYSEHRVYINDYAQLDVDAFLRDNNVVVRPVKKPSLPSYRGTPDDAYNDLRNEVAADWKNQQRSPNHVDRGIVYMQAIFNSLVQRGEVFDYADWLRFRFAYQDYTGASREAFDAMTRHAYWQPEWTKPEWERWTTDAPRSWMGSEGIDGGYLIWLARRLNVMTTNPIDLQTADLTIYDWAEMPQGSYLLKADMGTGKTQLQREAITRTLDKGQRVIFVVNTKQLARAAYGRFIDLNPTLYIDAKDAILPTPALKGAMFLVVVAQTFAKKVIDRRSDTRGVGLVIIDEVQQITASSVQPDNSVWSGSQQREYDNAVRLLLENNVEVHGLDAGINEQTRERFRNIPVVHYAAKVKRPKFYIYNRNTKVLDLLDTPREGLTVVASDTKDAEMGTIALSDRIRDVFPECRLLRVDHDTVTLGRDYDENAVAFLSNPDVEAEKYTHIVYSPAAQSGLSVQFPAEIVLHFGTYLVPKDNQQLIARFRNVKAIHSYYRNYRKAERGEEYEMRLQRAKVLLSGHMVERSEISRGLDYLTELGERDEMHQSLAPRDMFVSLLEDAGYRVRHRYTEGKDKRLDKREEIDTAAYEDNHWQENVNEPDNTGDYEAMAAHRQATHIIRTVGDAALNPDVVPDTVALSKAARNVRPYQVKNAYVMSGGEADYEQEIITATNADMPLSRRQQHVKRLTLMSWVDVLDYKGRADIPAVLLANNGLATWEHLKQQRDLWDAVAPLGKRWADLNDRTDPYTALRSMIKYMLTDWLGLKVSRGTQTRVKNPQTGARMYDIQVDGWEELEQLVYVYAHSRGDLNVKDERKAQMVSKVFDTMHVKAESDALVTFLEWLIAQPKHDQRKAVALIKSGENLSSTVDKVIHGGGNAVTAGTRTYLDRSERLDRLEEAELPATADKPF